MLHERYKNDGIPVVKLNNIQKKALDKLKLKIDKKTYKFEENSCCICKKSDFDLLSEKDRLGLYNPVVICKNCGLIQNNPRMSPNSYLKFYEYEYRKLFDGIEEVSDVAEIFKLEYHRGKIIYSFMKKSGIFKTKTKDLSVFEVGCGSGGILKYFQDNGFSVQGCDLDKGYLEFGKKKYDLNLFYGTLKDMELENTPDIIIYSHVLEHILDMNEEIKTISNLLNNDGFLYIEVPGISNAMEYNMDFLFFLHCHHVYHFFPTTLINLLGINGFAVIKIDKTIKGIFKKSENFLPESKITNEYLPSLRFLQKLEELRQSLVFKKIISKGYHFLKNNLNSYENLKATLKSIPNLLVSILLRYVKQINMFKGYVYRLLEKFNQGS